MTNLLGLMKRDVRIVQLTSYDRDVNSSALDAFRGLVLAHQSRYPKIDEWLEKRVLADLSDNPSRMAFVAYENSQPVGSAVLKIGERSKVCHLNVEEGHSRRYLGDLLFSLMLTQAAPLARSVYFTLPAALWSEKSGFFKSFGFKKADPADRQYRMSDEELVCNAAISEVWHSVLEKIPRLVDAFSVGGSAVKPSLLMSVRPRFADLILQEKKRVEIRTRFSKRWVGHKVAIYATAPIRCVVGEAGISSVTLSEPDELWRRFGAEIGCTRREFERYVGGRRRVYAIELDEVFPYRTLVPLDELDSQRPSPPQAYCRLLEGAPLTRATMMASLVDSAQSVRRSKLGSRENLWSKEGKAQR